MSRRGPGRRERSIAFLVALISVTAGCRQDMQDQPKYLPLQASRFFADHRASRPIPANTIARGHLDDDDAFHTGEVNHAFLTTIPAAITRPLMKRGEERYNIYCSPCHGLLGDGDGMVARRGLKSPADFHTDRLRQAPPGYLFEVISNGYGAMPDYATQIAAADRWAIVAYLRALQLSRNATAGELPRDTPAELGSR